MLNIQKYFPLILLVTLASGLPATTIWLKDFQKIYALGSYVELLEDESGIFDIQTVSNNFSGFQPYDEWDRALKTNCVYWGKLKIGNDLADAADQSEWVLSFPTSLTAITLYHEASPGVFKTFYSGTHQPVTKKSFAPTSEGNFLKITLPPGEAQTIYFRALAEREALPPEFDISLQHITRFYENLNTEKRDNSLFLGFVLMMLFYNLVMFVFIKDRAYLYYSFYLFSLSVFVAYKSGDLADVFEPVLFPAHPESVTFAKLSVYFTVFSYLAFIRKFSNLKELLPKWDRIFKGVAVLGIPILMLDFYLMLSSNFSYNVSDRATITYTLIFIAAIFGLTWPLAKTKNRSNRYILAGIAFLGMGIFLTVLGRFRSYEFSLIWFKAGTILDIVAFSLGLAYRQLANEKAKQAAHFQLEKNRILQEQEHAEARRQKDMNALKARFYTNFTHEFRTPLSVIQGVTGEIKGNKKAKELIARNTGNLLNLINQMLDLAKLESGKLKLRPQPGEIVMSVKYLCESFTTLALARKIDLSFRSEIQHLNMSFDGEKLQHIVYNLLSNAIKFTHEGGKIDILLRESVFKRSPALELIISDNGIGIPSKDIAHIFDRFYQAENPGGNISSGTGIGLSMTRELVKLMGGKITVESEQNAGTTFTILLPQTPIVQPLATDPTPVEALASAPFPVLAENMLYPDDHENESKFLTKNDDETPLLLLIEDNPDVIEFMKTLLKKRYKVKVARDGNKGIEKAVKLIPDLIISDVMMPEKDGYEVCRTLKSDERTSHIPIILVTAKSMDHDRIMGLNAGADAFLVKPFNQEELFVRINKLVTLRRTLQEYYAGNGLPDFQNPNKQQPAISFSLDDLFLQKIIRFIHANLENPNLSVNDLCNETHLSHTQLYRKTKALTGKPPVHFIRKIRLQKAMELLKTSEMNVSEVAYKVGFNDPNYFSRIFQQEFDFPPSAVRK
jgi:signal transduction histidine kinase/DNA-binding response OmpR family regulator